MTEVYFKQLWPYHTLVIVCNEERVREGTVTSIAGVPPRLKKRKKGGISINASIRDIELLDTFMDPELMLFDKFVQISLTLASHRGRTIQQKN